MESKPFAIILLGVMGFLLISIFFRWQDVKAARVCNQSGGVYVQSMPNFICLKTKDLKVMNEFYKTR